MFRSVLLLLGWIIVAAAVRGQADSGKPPVAPPIKSTATLSVDRDKMRELVYLPRTSLGFTFGMLSSEMPKRDEPSPDEQTKALQKKLTGTAGDAEIYYKLMKSDRASAHFRGNELNRRTCAIC